MWLLDMRYGQIWLSDVCAFLCMEIPPIVLDLLWNWQRVHPCHVCTDRSMCHLFNEICQLLRIQISKKFRICTLQSCHVASGGLNRWHEKSLLDEHLPSSKCCKVDSKGAILSQHDMMSQSSQGRPCSRDAWADAKAFDIQGTKQGPIHRNVRL